MFVKWLSENFFVAAVSTVGDVPIGVPLHLTAALAASVDAKVDRIGLLGEAEELAEIEVLFGVVHGCIIPQFARMSRGWTSFFSVVSAWGIRTYEFCPRRP